MLYKISENHKSEWTLTFQTFLEDCLVEDHVDVIGENVLNVPPIIIVSKYTGWSNSNLTITNSENMPVINSKSFYEHWTGRNRVGQTGLGRRARPFCNPINQCVECRGDADCRDYPSDLSEYCNTGTCIYCPSRVYENGRCK